MCSTLCFRCSSKFIGEPVSNGKTERLTLSHFRSDGRLTDSKGNTVNFRNTICIFTSNIGSSDILDLDGSSEEGDQEIMRQRVTQAMRDFFKPEFLNRIDEHVIFNSLNKEDLRGIVRIETKRLEKRLEDRQIELFLSEASLDYLADVGFDPVYGARPLKRTIQRELETNVARRILAGEIRDGDTVVVDVVNDRLSVYTTDELEAPMDGEEEEEEEEDAATVDPDAVIPGGFE